MHSLLVDVHSMDGLGYRKIDMWVAQLSSNSYEHNKSDKYIVPLNHQQSLFSKINGLVIMTS